MTDFEVYKQDVARDIEQTVTRANSQPVIFAGTGGCHRIVLIA
jgi:hypothetical protein